MKHLGKVLTGCVIIQFYLLISIFLVTYWTYKAVDEMKEELLRQGNVSGSRQLSFPPNFTFGSEVKSNESGVLLSQGGSSNLSCDSSKLIFRTWPLICSQFLTNRSWSGERPSLWDELQGRNKRGHKLVRLSFHQHVPDHRGHKKPSQNATSLQPTNRNVTLKPWVKREANVSKAGETENKLGELWKGKRLSPWSGKTGNILTLGYRYPKCELGLTDVLDKKHDQTNQGDTDYIQSFLENFLENEFW